MTTNYSMPLAGNSLAEICDSANKEIDAIMTVAHNNWECIMISRNSGVMVAFTYTLTPPKCKNKRRKNKPHND